MIKKCLVRLLSHAKKYIAWQVVFQWLGLLCQVVSIFAVATVLEAALDGSARRDLILQYAVFIVIPLGLRFVFVGQIDRM